MKQLHSAWLAGILTVAVSAAVALPAGAEDKATDRAQKVRGRVVRVQEDGRQLTLRTLAGKEVTVQVDEGAKVRRNRSEARLSQFKEGDRVVVSYEVKDGKNQAVTVSNAPTLEDLRRVTGEALDVAKNLTFQQKEEYQKKLEGVLRDVDQRIDDLKEQARDASEDYKKKYAQELDDLRKRKEAAQERVAKVKAATPEAWEDVKAGVSRALDDLQKALEKARTRYQEP